MTNQELETQIKNLIAQERRITTDVLRLINLAEDPNLHLERGYSSLFNWLTTGLGYSAAAAQRRIDSAGLIRVVPDALTKLRTGTLNLTNLSKVRTSIRAQEKKSGRRVTIKTQSKILSAIENQTTAAAELTLLQYLPDSASTVHQERTKRIDQNEQRLSLNLSNEDMENLAWIKDYLSHAEPNATNGQILSRLMREFRAKHSTSAAETKKAKAQRRSCEYRDELTGKVCGSTFQIEVDHIVPRALGGGDEPSNLRCLCRKHNQLAAEQWLGKDWAQSWRSSHGGPPGQAAPS